MNKEILMVIETVSNEKNVSKEVIVDAIEHALASSVKKKYRLDRKSSYDIDARVSIDLETGEYRTFRRWEIVDEIEDEELVDKQLLLQDEKISKKDLKVGDFYEEEIESIEFGRIVAMAAKNVIVQKVREAERSRIVDMYLPKIGQLIFGIVKRVEKGNVFIDLGMPDKQNSMEEAMILKDALIPRACSSVLAPPPARARCAQSPTRRRPAPSPAHHRSCRPRPAAPRPAKPARACCPATW